MNLKKYIQSEIKSQLSESGTFDLNESLQGELDIMAKEAKDLKSFVKAVYKEFDNLPRNRDSLKWLTDIYKDSTNESVNEASTPILKPGTKVKLRGGKSGKIVRFDGKTPGSPFYIVDIGQYYSLEVPAHEIQTESTNKSVNEAKDSLYLQLHKKYAESIKGLKAKKISKLTDLVSVQRWSMEDREDYFDMNPKKKKELSAEYDEERKLFKKYLAGNHSVLLRKGTESLAESVNEVAEPQIRKIAELTGVSIDKVEKYVSSRVLNITKLLKYIKDEKQVAIRDFVKAVDGDKKQDAYFIKMFNESVVTEGKTSAAYIDPKTGKGYDLQYVSSKKRWELDIMKKGASIYSSAITTIKRDTLKEIQDWLDGYKIDSKWTKGLSESLVTEARAANYKILVDVLLNAQPNYNVYYNDSHNVVNVGGVGYSGGDLTRALKLNPGQADSVKNEFYYAKEDPKETKKQIEKLSKGKIKVDISGSIVKYKVNESVVTEGAMSELDIMAKEAKDLKSFVKAVYKEFKTLDRTKSSLDWLTDIYNDSTNESVVNEHGVSFSKEDMVKLHKDGKVTKTDADGMEHDYTFDDKVTTPITERQLKGLDGIDTNTPLTKISYQQKLKIVQGTGNIIAFKVPEWSDRNFWQVIVKGKIKKGKNLSGDVVYTLPGKTVDSPQFKSEKELVDSVLWDSMEETRRFNESVVNEVGGTLKIEKQKDGKYYWTFTFKSGKVEEWPNGFATSAEAQKDFTYRSKYLKEGTYNNDRENALFNHLKKNESVVTEGKKLPKFKKIPSWANYVAQASDGEWTWYEDTPTMIKFKDGSGGAWKQDGNQIYSGVKTDGNDWDKTPTYYKVKNGTITESVNEVKKYKKGDKLKIKLKNGKEFDLTFDSYGRQKGMAFGKFDGDKKPFSLDTIKEEQLDEKLITFSNRAPYGQVVFMAGGAGSGKGFAVSNFIDSAGFKVRDVDEMKKAVANLDSLGKFSIGQWYDKFSKNLKEPELAHVNKYVKDKGLTIAKLADNLRDPNNVAALHFIVDAMGLKDAWVANMLMGKSNKEVLPNLLFDITAKKVASITDVLKPLLSAGYDPKNIHLIWVLTNYHLAVQNNATRSRVVPDDTMLQTHEGASNTLWQLLTKALPNGVNGRVDVILNNKENTVFYTGNDGKAVEKDQTVTTQSRGDTGKIETKRETEKVRFVSSFLSLPIKKQGGGIIPEKVWKDILYNWIMKNAPKTSKLVQGME
jgi:hypothetical protein